MLAWRIGRNEKSRNAQWIALVYGFVGLVFVLRTVSLGLGNGDFNILTEGLSTRLIVLTGLFFALVGHFSYVGLALDRQRSLGELSASLGHA